MARVFQRQENTGGKKTEETEEGEAGSWRSGGGQGTNVRRGMEELALPLKKEPKGKRTYREYSTRDGIGGGLLKGRIWGRVE